VSLNCASIADLLGYFVYSPGFIHWLANTLKYFEDRTKATITMATAVYNAEVLGKSVLLRFNDGTRSFYQGQIRGYKIFLEDVTLGKVSIEHFVEFEGGAGEKNWFDLGLEEAAGRLQWMQPSASSLAAPSPAKKMKVEQLVEPTHTEPKGVDDQNVALLLATDKNPADQICNPCVCVPATQVHYGKPMSLNAPHPLLMVDAQEAPIENQGVHSSHQDTLKSSSLQNAKSSPETKTSAILPSYQNCIPLKPPIPSKFQGDMEKVKSASVPDFSKLVNFSAHNQALPEGMRCCVLCGEPRPFGGSKQSQDCAFVIPNQNKGLCTRCDVSVWVVASSGLEIKWCKRCKNFRPWAAFGTKGRATKCHTCREEQRKKYAEQKKENNARFTEKSKM